MPGAPRGSQGLDHVLARAEHDVRALVEGGADGVIVENLGDAPFEAGRVDAFTVAAMTRITSRIRDLAPDLVLGVNVLRNDAISALSIAAATDADFLRVNVLSGAMVTDQGLIQGEARRVLLERRRLDASVRIAADVMVKHASPLAPLTMTQATRDTWHRAGADALIITGSGTGQPVSLDDLTEAREAAPDAPIWLGSGLTPALAEQLAPHLDAAIVGTWLHADADLDAPLDAARVRAMRGCLGG